MQNYHAIRQLNHKNTLKSGDVLVLFGELFSKGYATGLVDAAKARGLKVIYSTVGRRDKDGTLRPLNSEELALQPQPLINVPLEAGCDLEPDDSGIALVEHLKEVKLTDWERFQLPPGSMDQSRNRGRARFRKYTKLYLEELRKHIPPGANVIFAHLMAGGVPRAKVVLPIMNRIVKGSGERFQSSDATAVTGVGRLMLDCFNEVTAETFQALIEESSELRSWIQSQGGHTSYTAYGYHGTEVLIDGKYQWQTYSPYFQGWAKMKLESISREFSKKGVSTCVYNCPEILTNSSAIFSGVELSLYPLMGALRKEVPNSEKAKKVLAHCQDLFLPGHSIDSVLQFLNDYLTSDLIKAHCIFDKWPQGNSKDQLEKMLKAADHLVEIHKDQKNLVTFELSEVVFSACGKIMLGDAFKPEAPVSWINHDIIAKLTT
jgi:hypothetical protein